ncbi:MAG: FAD-dependent oxidoreductase [Anaerolineae bacterium]|nr:FAD-dependent oxidoreductase [Anaerolineae bacterium]
MASKPVIFAVDDDPSVLSAVSRDLRQHYGERFRIMRADSGAAALEALGELRQRNEAVALFLVDQRMPQMNGVEFLAEAISLYPDAKRALLTAYADTDAAIKAINTAAVHYYLLKPWDPPEEQLYPVLDDLIEDWQSSYRPPFSGIRIVGHRYSAETHQLKDFLARNHVPYRYLDIERDPEAETILQDFQPQPQQIPVVIMPDGTLVHAPTAEAVADRLGLQRQAGNPFYDLVIIGGGPAGLAAAVYGASEGLNTLMIERQATGGQAGTSSRIENYLGFPSGLSGADLARRATTQARRFGVEILAPQEAAELRLDGPYRILKLGDGSEVACHAVILAMGLAYRHLEIPNAARLEGAGIYYGASITEATSCQDQTVFVVGAGNSAGQAALYLAGFAQQVVVLVRGAALAAKMSQYLVDRIQQHPRIQVRLESVITAVDGVNSLECITVQHVPSGAEETLLGVGLFIFIGAIPRTDWLGNSIRRDKFGFILTGPALLEDGKPPQGWVEDRDPFLLESNVPGVFAVGDVRAQSVKRVASAVGEGSIAVQFVHQYLSRVK